MPDEIVIASRMIEGEITEPETKPVPAEPTFHLVARDPQEMAAATGNLTIWLEQKIIAIAAEITEVEVAREEARKHKWKISTFSSVIGKANQRKMFYEKVLDAVRAGFTIVPNFPIDLFAIRIDRGYPTRGYQYNYGQKAHAAEEKPDVLESGEGRYVADAPKVRHHTTTETMQDKSQRTKHIVTPIGFKDVEFPFAVARPEVMSATAEAMALKVFDQIGICPQSHRRRRGDPLIIGQVISDTPKWGEPKQIVSFLIAWHLDLRQL